MVAPKSFERDHTYASFSRRTSVLDAIEGATKPAQRVGFTISRVYGRSTADAIDEGDHDTVGPGEDL